MKLRLDLVLAAVLVATGGSQMMAPDAFSPPGPPVLVADPPSVQPPTGRAAEVW